MAENKVASAAQTCPCPVDGCAESLTLVEKPGYPGRVQAKCSCQRFYGRVVLESDDPANPPPPTIVPVEGEEAVEKADENAAKSTGPRAVEFTPAAPARQAGRKSTPPEG